MSFSTHANTGRIGCVQVIPFAFEESSDQDIPNLLSSSADQNSLKSILKSKGCEIKGKGGANYQRHGSFCINSLGLPAEDIGKNYQNNILIPGHNYEHRIIYKFGVVDQ